MITRRSLLSSLPFLALPNALHAAGNVRLGIDVLATSGFQSLKGKRVGLITNHTGVDSSVRRTREILHKAKGFTLAALYTPEHGLDGTELAGKYVSSRKDPLTGLTAHSLYGPTRKPSAEMLKGIDVLVYDMQDIGSRSYTYISTMARCMEAAGDHKIEFMVLDRPNPLGGNRVEGPMVEKKWISFVGQLPVPFVHGMTAGELARMLNDKGWMGSKCKLSVVRMEGWSRDMAWRDTGLKWVKTSPNIPRADSPLYYVATGLAGELAGLEIGIGGPMPFEFCCAKGLVAKDFTNYLNSLGVKGLTVEPYTFSGLGGARLHIDPHAQGDLFFLALAILAEVNAKASPDLFAKSSKDKLDVFFKVYGSASIRDDLAKRKPIRTIAAGWKDGLTAFRKERTPYLFY